AYADEGVDLRKAGISVPIMVMNADISSFSALTEFNLHPVIYSFQLLTQFEDYLKEQGLNNFPVHIEIESGMNRLGFSLEDVDKVAEHLKSSYFIKIETAFSHLAASEDPAQDVFTNEQAAVFNKAVSILETAVSYPFLKHISNSAAIIRHTNLQMDMVRLGIGLYGMEISTNHLNLQPVATLRSTIAQIKKLKAGETISYNRRGTVKENMVIATVRIGYADGYSRQFSNGVGKMWVNGKLAPVAGIVCMDMTMIDVTDVRGVKEGDEVIIFGKELPLQQMAEWANIIPYEIMTSVSQRVKRIYFQE
ncbi:MAG: alanine racemase, partial [Bacteroidota bacterium]|nr:alanine racemase [Bacteroidota bacterium]